MKLLDPKVFFESVYSEKCAAWPTIVLDFNGVFDQYAGWKGYVQRHPKAPGIEKFLYELSLEFNTIIVCSATMPIEKVMDWLYEHRLDKYIDYVTNHKPPAHVYVDDKAVTHRGNFDETLQKIRGFKPHWKKDKPGTWVPLGHKGQDRPPKVADIKINLTSV